MRAFGDVVDLRRLHMHAADDDDVGPFEFGRCGRADVLVDEADRPLFRHIGRDQQEPLRRHEGAHAFHQPVGVIERAERRRVMRKDTQDPALGLDWDRAAHATSDLTPHGRPLRAGTQGAPCLQRTPRFIVPMFPAKNRPFRRFIGSLLSPPSAAIIAGYAVGLPRRIGVATFLHGRIFCGKPPKSAVADLGNPTWANIERRSRVNPRSVPTFPENALGWTGLPCEHR